MESQDPWLETKSACEGRRKGKGLRARARESPTFQTRIERRSYVRCNALAAGLHGKLGPVALDVPKLLVETV